MVNVRGSPRFVGELHVTLLLGGRFVRTDHPFLFIDKHGVEWAVRRGLISDGATIPRLFWPLIGGPFEGNHRRAAILHDAAYADQFRPRREADAMLFAAMRCDGGALADSIVIYLAVRAFGWLAWKHDKQRKEKNENERRSLEAD